MLTTHLKLLPRSGKRGSIHPLPHMSSWSGVQLVKHRVTPFRISLAQDKGKHKSLTTNKQWMWSANGNTQVLDGNFSSMLNKHNNHENERGSESITPRIHNFNTGFGEWSVLHPARHPSSLAGLEAETNPVSTKIAQYSDGLEGPRYIPEKGKICFFSITSIKRRRPNWLEWPNKMTKVLNQSSWFLSQDLNPGPLKDEAEAQPPRWVTDCRLFHWSQRGLCPTAT
jgi:hypothetical protein